MGVEGPGGGALPAGAGGAGGSGPVPSGPVGINAIVDTALNPLLPGSTISMLGFVDISPDELLQLQIYLFLIDTIRIEDNNNGDLFVKRYLEGPQTVWEQIQAKIFSIKDLWSISSIPDEYLKYLKNIVGWTGSLEPITDALDDDTLRRLIANSVDLWKSRGPEVTITSILTLVTGTRTRSWNWFDFRWVSEETGFGHESDGYDPHTIDIDNYQEMNVRIMDYAGTVDRGLVINLIKLMRPCGERVEVTYLHLLDLFNVDDDDVQWNALDDASSTDIFTVLDGSGRLTNTARREEIYTNVLGSDAWSQYLFSARLRGASKFGVTFYRDDEDNYYMFRLNTSGVADNFELVKRVVGVETTLVTVAVPTGFIVDPLLYYMYRVTVAAEGVANRIQCYVDGFEVINTLDSEFTQGGVGVIHSVSGNVEVDETEVLSLPVDTDYVDINS